MTENGSRRVSRFFGIRSAWPGSEMMPRFSRIAQSKNDRPARDHPAAGRRLGGAPVVVEALTEPLDTDRRLQVGELQVGEEQREPRESELVDVDAAR